MIDASLKVTAYRSVLRQCQGLLHHSINRSCKVASTFYLFFKDIDLVHEGENGNTAQVSAREDVVNKFEGKLQAVACAVPGYWVFDWLLMGN